MSVDEATWSAIRRAYCCGAASAAALAREHGVSVHAIRYRVKRDGWKKDSAKGKSGRKRARAPANSNCKRRVANVADDESETLGGSSPDTKARVVARLYRAILRKLTRLEERLERDDALTAAESERQTRELSTMVRSFEKITGVAADIELQRKPGRRREKDRGAGAGDAERMRQEIAERLERLNAQWELTGESKET